MDQRGKEQKQAGSSVFLDEQKVGYYYSLENKCTIMTAELVAIWKAMQLIKTMVENKESIIICSDSQSAIEVIESCDISVYKNNYIIRIRTEIEKLSNEIGKEFKIVFAWVPAHFGVESNEIADKIAKKGTDEQKDCRILIPFTDMRNIYKVEMFEMTKRRIIGTLNKFSLFSNR